MVIQLVHSLHFGLTCIRRLGHVCSPREGGRVEGLGKSREFRLSRHDQDCKLSARKMCWRFSWVVLPHSQGKGVWRQRRPWWATVYAQLTIPQYCCTQCSLSRPAHFIALFRSFFLTVVGSYFFSLFLPMLLLGAFISSKMCGMSAVWYSKINNNMYKEGQPHCWLSFKELNTNLIKNRYSLYK